MTNIILLGLVSLFVNISTEMVYPLIPIYLTTIFGVTPTLIGIIEGIAESIASFLKILSGHLSDKYKKKKLIAIIGYSMSLIYKIALITSSSWFGILIARSIDRFGKGVRTAPRDVLVSVNAEDKKQGAAFGLHKSLDMAGSAIGILIAYLLIENAAGVFAFEKIFLYSVIPAVIGIIILFFMKEKQIKVKSIKQENVINNLKKLDIRLKLFLVVIFIFNLGNSSNVFLLLRAQNIGIDAATVILLYFVYNFVASILAMPIGKLSDKVGRSNILVIGYFVFSLTYFGFAFFNQKFLMIILFAMYGVYTAFTVGVERALISEISPSKVRGTMLGTYSAIIGIALLPASVIAGFLWDTISPSAPFIVGSILALVSSVCIKIILSNKNNLI